MYWTPTLKFTLETSATSFPLASATLPIYSDELELTPLLSEPAKGVDIKQLPPIGASIAWLASTQPIVPESANNHKQ